LKCVFFFFYAFLNDPGCEKQALGGLRCVSHVETKTRIKNIQSGFKNRRIKIYIAQRATLETATLWRFHSVHTSCRYFETIIGNFMQN